MADDQKINEIDSEKRRLGCWYFKGTCDSCNVHLLVDTGSAVAAILDFKVWKSLSKKHKSPLQSTKMRLLNADGHDLKLVGSSCVDICFDEEHFEIDFLIAESLGGAQGLLGAPWLAGLEMVIDMARGELLYRGRGFKLNHRQDKGVNLVLTEKLVQMKPSECKVIEGGLCEGNLWEGDALLEDWGSGSVNLVPGLVAVKSHKKFPFALRNGGDTVMTILPYTPIGMSDP